MKNQNGNSLYDDAFYNDQMEGSYRSAAVYVPHLLKILKPRSVADLGCGRGTWLKAFRENGVDAVVGFDGPWNSQENMVDPTIRFVPVDLNKPINIHECKFDLAISLEVAEHLRESSAKDFVIGITALSDAVLFGAAYTQQGGTDHINEQPNSYWAKMFVELGYRPYDLFRPIHWGNDDIEFWYRQNTFLYVNSASELNQELGNAGYRPMPNIDFMDCIHPNLYNRWVSAATAPLAKRLLLGIIPRKLLPIAMNMKRQLLK